VKQGKAQQVVKISQVLIRKILFFLQYQQEIPVILVACSYGIISTNDLLTDFILYFGTRKPKTNHHEKQKNRMYTSSYLFVLFIFFK